MSDFAPDLVGFSGTRVFDTIAAASVTRSAIVLKIVNTLVAAGWTKLSGPTTVGFGDEYELYSAQSPWYDTANVPAWYIGGRVYMKISHPNSNGITFQFGEYYNSTPTDVMTLTNFQLSFSQFTNGPYNFYILGNPYECWIWSSNTGAEGSTQLYCGALNVPKPLQQKNKIISAILGTRFRISNSILQASGTSFLGFRTKDQGATQSYQYNNSAAIVSFLAVKGGGSGNAYTTGKALWTPATDPRADDPTKWNYFSYPAQVAFPVGSSGASYTFVGFLWDSFCISKNYTRNSTIGLIDKVFMAYAGGTGATDGTPANLFLNIGPTGTAL